jgi:starvation-inducible DNA-binding protein
MKNPNTTKELKNALADTYALYIKTQNYHWNVTGPNFPALHLLFESQYEDLAEAVDLIAERIRALGSKTPTSFTVFNDAKTISDGDENADWTTMVKNLADDQLAINKTLNKAMSAAKAEDDEATINLLADRLTLHDKNHWMLKASLE